MLSRTAAARPARLILAALPAAAVLAAGCGSSATPPAGSGGGRVCEALQGAPRGGLNGAASAAVAAAHEQLGVTPVVGASATGPGYASMLGGRCRLIVAAGSGSAPSVLATAARYPRQQFLIVDDWFTFGSAPDLTRRNVSVAAFEADQGAFLAGYVAAAVSPHHVVGAYGGVNSRTVVRTLNGFLAGARDWGADFRTQVRVLGWNGTRGPFTGNDADAPAARAITSGLIRRGAQVIFGVTGPAIRGSLAAAAARPAVYVIGMYSGYDGPSRLAGRWLTSVELDMRAPVRAAVAAAAHGHAAPLYVGTLANGGVRLAPFGARARLVPRAVLARLPALRTGFAQGWLSTDPADYVPREKERGNGNG